jgi:hypothetical protein
MIIYEDKEEFHALNPNAEYITQAPTLEEAKQEFRNLELNSEFVIVQEADDEFVIYREVGPLVGTGRHRIKRKRRIAVTFETNSISEEARRRIEAAGGTITKTGGYSTVRFGYLSKLEVEIPDDKVGSVGILRGKGGPDLPATVRVKGEPRYLDSFEEL